MHPIFCVHTDQNTKKCSSHWSKVSSNPCSFSGIQGSLALLFTQDCQTVVAYHILFGSSQSHPPHMSDKLSGQILNCRFRLCSLRIGYFPSGSDISQEGNRCKYHFRVCLRIHLVGMASNSNFQLFVHSYQVNNSSTVYCQSRFGIVQEDTHYM